MSSQSDKSQKKPDPKTFTLPQEAPPVPPKVPKSETPLTPTSVSKSEAKPKTKAEPVQVTPKSTPPARPQTGAPKSEAPKPETPKPESAPEAPTSPVILKNEDVQKVISDIEKFLKNLEEYDNPTKPKGSLKLTLNKVKLSVNCLLFLVSPKMFPHNKKDGCEKVKKDDLLKKDFDELKELKNLTADNINTLYKFTFDTLKVALPVIVKHLQGDKGAANKKGKPGSKSESKSEKKAKSSEKAETIVSAGDINNTINFLRELIEYTLGKNNKLMGTKNVYGGQLHQSSLDLMKIHLALNIAVSETTSKPTVDLEKIYAELKEAVQENIKLYNEVIKKLSEHGEPSKISVQKSAMDFQDLKSRVDKKMTELKTAKQELEVMKKGIISKTTTLYDKDLNKLLVSLVEQKSN